MMIRDMARMTTLTFAAERVIGSRRSLTSMKKTISAVIKRTKNNVLSHFTQNREAITRADPIK